MLSERDIYQEWKDGYCRVTNELGVLTIQWAGVLDNEEGIESFPPIINHGPKGSLHVLVYPESQAFPDDAESYPVPLAHSCLRGPTQGEWLDENQQRYPSGLKIFRWDKSHDAVTVFVFESDPTVVISGRKHDAVFFRTVTRAGRETGECEKDYYSSLLEARLMVSSDVVDEATRVESSDPWLQDAFSCLKQNGEIPFWSVWDGKISTDAPKAIIWFTTRKPCIDGEIPDRCMANPN